MERMPIGKPEKHASVGETVDWCLQRMRAQPELEKYVIVLEQGKRDLGANRVPDWDFMMVLKQLKFMLDADGVEDDYMMIQVDKLTDWVREKRRKHIEAHTTRLENEPQNRDPHRPNLGPPVINGPMIEA